MAKWNIPEHHKINYLSEEEVDEVLSTIRKTVYTGTDKDDFYNTITKAVVDVINKR